MFAAQHLSLALWARSLSRLSVSIRGPPVPQRSFTAVVLRNPFERPAICRGSSVQWNEASERAVWVCGDGRLQQTWDTMCTPVTQKINMSLPSDALFAAALLQLLGTPVKDRCGSQILPSSLGPPPPQGKAIKWS